MLYHTLSAPLCRATTLRSAFRSTSCCIKQATICTRAQSTFPVRKQFASTLRSNKTCRGNACKLLVGPTARNSSTLAAQESAAAPSVAPSEQSLTWNRFLALRRTRRRISLVASIISAGTCFVGGVVILQAQELENTLAGWIGLDPLIALGLATFACGGAGWLIGPFFGNALFNLMNRSVRPQMVAKEKEFFNRIKKHRVDPTSSSYGNPVPDYYGEKIGSVADYRRWLKDQRAFNLKREKIL